MHFRRVCPEMFFRIGSQSLLGGRPLHGMVSSDGILHFKAADVGNLLGYQSPQSFALRETKLRVQHVTYQKFQSLLPVKVWRMLIMPFDQTLTLLKTLGELKRKPKIVLFARQLENEKSKIQIVHGSIANPKFPTVHRLATLSVKMVPKSEDPQENELYLQDFLNNFIIHCLEMYNDVYDRMSRMEEPIYYVDALPLEQLNIEQPPATVNVCFGDFCQKYVLA